jgi:hypothetical protein
VAITSADVVLMRRRPLTLKPHAIPEGIGLHADADGGGVRVQWDRKSRQVLNADHATLFIEDGAERSQLDLSGRQLDGSTVMYLPRSERVNFRLEVYRGGQSSSDSTGFSLPQDPNRRREGPARAIVEQARPSPFEHTTPEIVVTQTRPSPVLPVSGTVTTPEQAAPEPPKESRLDRFISKIPLFRRLRKHPPADETQPRW